jgi:hypothetical protein
MASSWRIASGDVFRVALSDCIPAWRQGKRSGHAAAAGWASLPATASVSLASPVFGYAMGQHAADWLDGKSIPQADPARRASYLKMYGNICYDTRDRYVNFPWSSERK